MSGTIILATFLTYLVGKAGWEIHYHYRRSRLLDDISWAEVIRISRPNQIN